MISLALYITLLSCTGLAAETPRREEAIPVEGSFSIRRATGRGEPNWAPTAGFSASASSTAQDSRVAGSSYRFRVDVQEVLVPATVTDPAGHLVTGLELQEFRLFEDGVEQVLDSVQAEKAPFTVGIVVDASGSMKGKIEATRLALARFLDYLEPRDRAFILVFNNYVEQLRDLTNDHRSLRDALLGLEPQGGTALFDAVVESLYRLHKNPARKRALLVLSDGMDNNSQNSAREAVRAAKATGIPIYTVGMGKKRSLFFFRLFGESVRDEFRQLDEIHLRELAEFTGGRALFLADMKERESGHPGALGEAFDRVAKELRSLYLLSYRPKRAELDGQWHHLRVEVHRSGHFVRFRPGYLAVPLQ